MAGITVGIDGSDGARRALGWAMKEAAAHHAPLTVVTVHEVAASGWTGNPVILSPDEAAVEKARHAAEESVAKAAAQLGESQPPSVTVRAVNGFPPGNSSKPRVMLTCWWWAHAAAAGLRG